MRTTKASEAIIASVAKQSSLFIRFFSDCFATLAMAGTFLFSCFILSTAVYANTLQEIQGRGTLRVGTEPNYYPFELINKKGEMMGFDIDIAKAMAKAMGVKLEIVNTTVDSIIPGLIANKYDIFMRGITLTQERNLRVNFANPYFISGQTILLKATLAGTIQHYEALNNPQYTVVSKIGTTGEWSAKRLLPKARYISFDTEQEGVLEVLHGRADAFVFDEPFNTLAVLRYGDKRLVHLNKPFTYEPLAWGVRQGDVDFLNWLNHFLDQIRHDGTYDKLHHKWFVEKAWLSELQNS